MKPSSAKAKGQVGQDNIMKLILKVRPDWEIWKDDMKGAVSSEHGADIQFYGALRDLVPFVAECKKYKRFSICRHYEQAQQHALVLKKKHLIREPILFIEENHKRPLALVDAEWLLEKVLK